MIQIIDVELTHYRVPVYNLLQDRLREQVFVYHGQPRVADGLRIVSPDEKVGFPHAPLQTSWLLGRRVLVRNLKPPLEHRPPPRAVIVRPLLRDVMLLPAIAAFKARSIPVIGWGHGFSRRRTFRPERRLLDRGYLAIVRYLDAYIFYTEDIRARFAEFVSPERLFVARNALDTAQMIDMRRELEATGRSVVRDELGLRRSHYLSFIGRLQARKGLAELIDVYARLSRTEDRDIGLLIIGDGPMRQELEDRISDLALSGVHLLGARYEEEAARYLFASDVMVMPGALGLAVPHAFALGVPVVSRYLGDGLVGHGPEASYIEHGVNGRMAAVGDDTESLAEEVRIVLDDRDAYSRAASEFVDRSLTLSDMVDGFVEAIRFAAG